MSTDVAPTPSPAPTPQGGNSASAPASGTATPAPAAAATAAAPSTEGSKAKTSDPSSAKKDGKAGSATVTNVNGQTAPSDPVKETSEELRAQLDGLRRELAMNLQKKQAIDKALVGHESSIYAFESSYLAVDLGVGNANTSFGNIVRGYDAYLKSGSSSHTDSGRKKGSSSSSRGGGANAPGGAYGGAILGPGGALIQPINEEERLFSKSSTTYQDSLNLRERDAGQVTASEPEDEDDAASSTGQGPPKRQKKK